MYVNIHTQTHTHICIISFCQQFPLDEFVFYPSSLYVAHTVHVSQLSKADLMPMAHEQLNSKIQIYIIKLYFKQIDSYFTLLNFSCLFVSTEKYKTIHHTMSQANVSVVK